MIDLTVKKDVEMDGTLKRSLLPDDKEKSSQLQWDAQDLLEGPNVTPWSTRKKFVHGTVKRRIVEKVCHLQQNAARVKWRRSSV